jgi:hypothetical protein
MTSREESFLVRIASTMSTARMWQISSADEGTVGVAPAIEDDSKGLAAAEIAVLVPNLRASLRVMFPLIVLLSR